MALYIVKPWYKKEEPPTPALIYGAEWSGGSSPVWTRTDAAANFADPNPYYAGMSGTPGSPFDNIMPWAGMRRVTDANAGELVEIPKFYYKLSQPNGVGLKVQISMSQFDGSSVDPMHMDRGDGVGEREYAYIGRYHCGSNGYKSTSGQTPYVNATRATMRTNIHNLGSNVWQYDFMTRFTVLLLYLVEFANWDSQRQIGYGCGNGSSVQNMGYTDNMPYHTGTMLSNKATYGCSTQYRYIEGLWENVIEYLDGCYYNANGLNIIKNPNNYSDGAGGIAVGVPSNGFPTGFNISNITGAFPLIIPTGTTGSDSTYTTDAWFFYPSNPSSYPVVHTGYTYIQTLNTGISFMGYDEASKTESNRGSRLMVLPPSRLSA